MSTQEEDEEEQKEYYLNRVWQCRDFEIQHFWQRSGFLATFIVLIYTGYGAFWGNILVEETNTKMIHHFISIGVLFLGCIFSSLWIMMAKGSKYWYEIYEKKIWKMEHSKYHNENFIVQDREEVDSWVAKQDELFFNTLACRYSVSSINIAIGQISFFICLLLLIGHVVYLLIIFIINNNWLGIIGILIFIMVAPSLYIIKKELKSNS